MSFVDFGVPAGFAAAGDADEPITSSGGALAAGASAGGVSEGPPLLPVCARAAFRISSVESFFAIFSYTWVFSET